MDMPTVLDRLFNEGTVFLETANKTVKIRKVTARTLDPVLGLASKALEELQLDGTNRPTVDIANPVVLLKLISKFLPEVRELLSKLSDMDSETILDLEADDLVLLTRAVYERNKHFFITKVAGILGIENLFQPTTGKGQLEIQLV